MRNNTSSAYRLRISNLPWDENTRYTLQVHRVGGGRVHDVVMSREGSGSSIGESLLFPCVFLVLVFV